MAIMGGFAIKITENDGLTIFPEGHQRLVVRPEALLWLFETEPNTRPIVTTSDLKDKSKADGLAKTLITIQGRRI